MKKLLLALAMLSILCPPLVALRAQSGLYVPAAKPVKDMQKALVNPQAFYLLLSYQGNDSTYKQQLAKYAD